MLSPDVAALSLLEALSETGFQASVVSTYSCYFPFYEEVVLRRLLDRGCVNNVLMVDAGQCAKACATEDQRPRRAGRDYTLIPVRLSGAFHPKLIVTVGKTKGALFVGSHNMTLAGFGLNDELTNQFRTRGTAAREGSEPIRRTLDYLESFVPAGLADVSQAFVTVRRGIPWLEGPVAVESNERRLLTTTGEDEDLWRRIRLLLPTRVSTAFVCGPFFDRKLSFLQQVLDDAKPQKLVVGVDPESVEIEPTAVRTFSGVEFVNIAGAPRVPNRRTTGTRYLHAKVLWFVGPEAELLVTGSANPSAPAFLAHGTRNAEAVVVDQRAGTAQALGLDALVDAPAVTDAEWSRVAARRAELTDRDGPTGTIVLAVPAVGGFLLERTIGAGIVLEGVAADGIVLGQAVSSAKDPTLVDAPDIVRDGAQFLRSGDSNAPRVVILVHRPELIARNVGGDRQRELRQALGALDEDPAQLETLLKLAEKVIFDSDDVVRTQTQTSRKGADRPEGQDTSKSGPDSLAVDAVGRKSNRQKKSVASGDILVLLDALMSRLGQGLSSTGPERPPAEDVLPTTDEDSGDEHLELPRPYDDLAHACTRKVGQLVRRMKGQLELANKKDDAARRAVIQLAAVLSVMHTLRTMEQRTEWRTKHLTLVDTDHERQLLEAGAMAIGWGTLALAPRAIEESEGERFQELSVALGLLAWLAWDVGINVVAATTRSALSDLGTRTKPRNPWQDAQIFATVATQLFDDPEASDVLRRAVSRTERRDDDGANWLRTHLLLAERMNEVQQQPDALAQRGRAPQKGDLVVLNQDFSPRVRVILDVAPSGSSCKITVLDRQTETGERQFLATYVATTEWQQSPAEAARAAGA